MGNGKNDGKGDGHTMRASGHQGEGAQDPDEEATDDADFDPGEYDVMLRLEQLESLEEEMRELGVKTLDEVQARIAQLHRQLDEQDR